MRAEGFFCSPDVLYGGRGIGKLHFLIKKIYIKISGVNFLQFLVINTLDTDQYSLIQPKMLGLDPDPDQINTDPKHWSHKYKLKNNRFSINFACQACY